MASASRSKRSENCTPETLIATSRFKRGSRARYTSPMPPAPICARISYRPSFVPTESSTCKTPSLPDKEAPTSWMTRHTDRAGKDLSIKGQWRLEATGHEAKDSKQTETFYSQDDPATAGLGGREVRRPQQSFLSRRSARLPACDR